MLVSPYWEKWEICRRLTDLHKYARLQVLTLVFLEMQAVQFATWHLMHRGADRQSVMQEVRSRGGNSPSFVRVRSLDFTQAHLFGIIFLEPRGCWESNSGGQSRTLVKEQGCHDFDIRLWGTKALSKKAYMHWDWRTQTHLLFYFILFRIWHCVILQRLGCLLIMNQAVEE